MQTAALDFAADDTLAGFRLQRLEVYNWGTFNQHVWQIQPDGHNALLTGDIGSGKSTLVDAITTLLVPHHRIVYNKAAGAEGKERNLHSYVRGEYANQQDDMTQGAKAVALRDEKNYTVLLGCFYNSGFDQYATLAQVFWLKPGQRNPERFFVFTETPLSIAEHFSGFGERITDLKKQLRKLAHTEVFTTFTEYENAFRRYFGIKQKNALDLFYQTVSMKSVGKLTDFVRQHMLEEINVNERIDDLRQAFDNLNRAHESVLKARQQIALLEPLIADGERYQSLLTEIETLTGCRNSLEYWFAGHEVELTTQLINKLEDELQRLRNRITALKEEIEELRLQANQLRQSIDDNGGALLKQLDADIARLQKERSLRKQKWLLYEQHCQALELTVADNADSFADNQLYLRDRLPQLDAELEELEAQKLPLEIERKQAVDQGHTLEKEIASLEQRRSNIPTTSLQLRALIAEALQLDESELPFAGELLQVDEEQQLWRGAIERVMHNFALSLLVPEQHYAAVSAYVDATHLGGRIVYYRTRNNKRTARPVEPLAMSRKLRIKDDSEHYSWLQGWLNEHFNHICCETLDDFRKQKKALTPQGQIKSGSFRHEKDDRHRLDDASRYVLGWDNADKIKALQLQLDHTSQQIIRLADDIASLNATVKTNSTLRDHCRDLSNIQPFGEIDWYSPTTEIDALQQQKEDIEKSSDKLNSLRTQLRITEGAIKTKNDKYEGLSKELGSTENRLNEAQLKRGAAQELYQQWPETLQPLSDAIQQHYQTVHGDKTPSLRSLPTQQSELRKHLQSEIDNGNGRIKTIGERINNRMSDYKNRYKVETQEVDATLASLPEYADMLNKLNSEDLPRHEARFRDMLREQTTNGLAMFRANLQREQQEIRERIDTINRSLKEIEYNDGSYITLLSDPVHDTEISEFQQQLRGVTEGALNEEELYTEERFLKVKAIIDRFNGRDGMTELDKRWTTKVTDVRNWFNFSASERWQADDSEKEFYSDSAGKSGGQKEKLAYTILASALAYQFGLEWGNIRSRSFRFVVIDEAFGRGSDESTRYGLELFKKLNLQLLIVTPLQKIHVIENYIDAVHFIHNEEGKNSVINNLTLEQYRAGKQAHDPA